MRTLSLQESCVGGAAFHGLLCGSGLGDTNSLGWRVWQETTETPAYVGLIRRSWWTGSEEMNIDWSYFQLERWSDMELMMAPQWQEGMQDSAGTEDEQEPSESDEKPVTSTPTRAPKGTATSTRTPSLTPSPEETPTPPQMDRVPGIPQFGANFAPVNYVAPRWNSASSIGIAPLPFSMPFQQMLNQTITYTYDSLYRLAAADYSNDDYYHYTYDAVGNRLTEETHLETHAYVYDTANRLTSVDSVSYTWDNNGNLLSDGANTYAYDSANRLTSVNGTTTYAYNGLGDRASQTVDSQTTTYVLDLNAGLTQVLDDGESTYIYGVGRISQRQGSTAEYFLGDALGSVRQLTNSNGDITLAKSYDPYGVVTGNTGSGTSPFAYTGEQQDASGMVYLRARYYSSDTGRFLSRDTWSGDYNNPLSLNRWMYVEGNPINLTDPSGKFPEWCKSMGERLQYEDCVRRYYGLSAPVYYPTMPQQRQEGLPGCWSGPVAYRAPGYLVGHATVISFGASYSFGSESVFDFGTMERGKFGFETAGLALEASISEMGYHGIVFGFNNVQTIEQKYRGSYAFLGSGFSSADFLGGFSLGVGVTGFVSFDGELTGISEYYSIGGGVTLIPGGSISGGVGQSTPTGQKTRYTESDNVDFYRLTHDIHFNPDFPLLNFIPSTNMNGIALAYHFIWIYEEIHLESH